MDKLATGDNISILSPKELLANVVNVSNSMLMMMTNDDDDAEDGWEIEDGFGPSLDYGRPRRLPSAATV